MQVSSSLFIPSPHFLLPKLNPQISTPFFFLSKRPNLSKSAQTPSSSSNPHSNDFKTPESLELLNKPKPSPLPPPDPNQNPESTEKLNEALAPFLRFFKNPSASEEEVDADPYPTQDQVSGNLEEEEEEEDRVGSKPKYYDPKPGDLVVGVVVAGNENKMDVNVGADMLGTMLTKDALPMYGKEADYLLCDLGKEGEREEFMVAGKMGIVRDEDALGLQRRSGRPVVEAGTVVFTEVLGRTLSGRPLLSSRRMYRRVAWHRVRQVMQLNEPIEVKIFEWNTGGLLTRIEGLRAFLPKAELMRKVDSFMDLKDNVGRRLYVSIVRIDELTNDLIISEKEAWDKIHLKEGNLLEGTVSKIFPFGAQVRIGETNRSGLLHISKITRARVSSVNDILKVDEKVKVLVIKSMFPDKISLSIADLESEPGLFLLDKEKVFLEAEEMAKRYRQRLPVILLSGVLDPSANVLPFDDEARFYSNWRWFEFVLHKDQSSTDQNAS